MRAMLAAAVLLSLCAITAIVAIVFATRYDDEDEIIVISTRVPETAAPPTNTPQTPTPQQGLNFTEYYDTNCRFGLTFRDFGSSPGISSNATDEWQANVTACFITQQGHCNETGYVRDLALLAVPPGSNVFEVNGDQLFGLPGRRLDNLQGNERNIFVHIPAPQGVSPGTTSKLSMYMSCFKELTPVPATLAPAVPVPITKDSGTSSNKKAAVAFGVVSGVLLAAAIAVGVVSILRPQPEFCQKADGTELAP
eukprot:Rhum_TRINITY_DN13877_c0_g1::Rhum_TRINITY_DN13877_c0_g1_i2::g.64437::m.64437